MRRFTLPLLALLAAGTPGSLRAEEPKAIRALLVLGGCCHDYAKQKDILTKGISDRANVEWVIAFDRDIKKGEESKHLNPVYDKADWAKGFDVVVHDECSADVKDLKVVANILKPHREGLPAVVLHCAMHSFRSEGWPKVTTPWFEFTGLATTGHGAQLPIAVAFDKSNPITAKMENWDTGKEELYNNISGKLLETAHPLARGKQVAVSKDGKEKATETIVVWTNTYNGKAKVFATTLGHNNDTCSDARYLDLVTNGLLWSLGKLDDAAARKPAKKVLADYEAMPKGEKK